VKERSLSRGIKANLAKKVFFFYWGSLIGILAGLKDRPVEGLEEERRQIILME
jgi:hypothetical protein